MSLLHLGRSSLTWDVPETRFTPMRKYGNIEDATRAYAGKLSSNHGGSFRKVYIVGDVVYKVDVYGGKAQAEAEYESAKRLEGYPYTCRKGHTWIAAPVTIYYVAGTGGGAVTCMPYYDLPLVRDYQDQNGDYLYYDRAEVETEFKLRDLHGGNAVYDEVSKQCIIIDMGGLET